MEYYKKFQYAGAFIISLMILPRVQCMDYLARVQCMDYLVASLAAAGTWGTYQTLVSPSSMHIGDSCKNFFRAMKADTAGHEGHISISVRSLLLNFPKHFKFHEKIALIASCSALLMGGCILTKKLVNAILAAYKMHATHDAERKKEYKKELMDAGSDLEVSLIATTISYVSCKLLYDYITSKK